MQANELRRHDGNGETPEAFPREDKCLCPYQATGPRCTSVDRYMLVRVGDFVSGGLARWRREVEGSRDPDTQELAKRGSTESPSNGAFASRY